jgi:hypothetical protein
MKAVARLASRVSAPTRTTPRSSVMRWTPKTAAPVIRTRPRPLQKDRQRDHRMHASESARSSCLASLSATSLRLVPLRAGLGWGPDRGRRMLRRAGLDGRGPRGREGDHLLALKFALAPALTAPRGQIDSSREPDDVIVELHPFECTCQCACTSIRSNSVRCTYKRTRLSSFYPVSVRICVPHCDQSGFAVGVRAHFPNRLAHF